MIHCIGDIMLIEKDGKKVASKVEAKVRFGCGVWEVNPILQCMRNKLQLH